MTLYDVFKQMGFELPIEVENGDVAGSLKSFFDIFYNQLKTLPSLDHQSDGIHYVNNISPIEIYRLSVNLISIINESTLENFAQSYSSFRQNYQASRVFAYLKNIPHQVKTIPIGTSFYRVRPLQKKECKEQVERIEERKELFHIPFDSLFKVKNYRYSIKEVPALYLSTSLPLALEETRIEKHTPYAVVRFETTQEINIINVDYSYYLYYRFEEVMREQTDIFLFLGMILPIVAACSIKVPSKHEGNDFKEEYIIPQLLMKYVQDYRSEYQAIRFYSSRINLGDPSQHKDKYNLVLPTKVTSTSGYDENLKTLFYMTDVKNVLEHRNPHDVENELQQMNAYKIDF